jgi:UDP-N-acetylglucosamine--N-acetylmuramyl-(pentapeptide) pyrophosphoryl-undecaprenol N-acetylglucosamine transferase
MAVLPADRRPVALHERSSDRVDPEKAERLLLKLPCCTRVTANTSPSSTLTLHAFGAIFPFGPPITCRGGTTGGVLAASIAVGRGRPRPRGRHPFPPCATARPSRNAWRIARRTHTAGTIPVGQGDKIGMTVVHYWCVRTLLVANSGGHLEELWLLHTRLTGSSSARTWVTWDCPHSRSLLAGEDCIFVDPADPRDALATLRNARHAREILTRGEWSEVVSTGSVPAVPFFTLARAQGIPCHYIESAARVTGPSLTARVLEWIPGVHRYSQHRGWADRHNWSYGGSVFDAYGPALRETGPRGGHEIERVVVTLGSNSYGFRPLVEGLLRVLPAGADVLWQTGETDVSGLGIDAVKLLPSGDLLNAMHKADLVVAHAGVGSALAAMQAGHAPLLVPRRSHRNEHVDDHQVQIARHLVSRGIAVACDADQLNLEIMAVAASQRVVSKIAPQFVLHKDSPSVFTPLLRPRRHAIA